LENISGEFIGFFLGKLLNGDFLGNSDEIYVIFIGNLALKIFMKFLGKGLTSLILLYYTQRHLLQPYKTTNQTPHFHQLHILQ
jgi:hypothetical protein